MYRTGNPYHLREQLAKINRVGTGELIPGYFNIVYQPLRNTQGEVTGIIASATEVTEQVLARQQVEQLNQQLEAKVLARTQALHLAYAAVEKEREQLYQVFEKTPLAIAIMRGPNLRVELANPAVAAIWGREASQVVGRPYLEALPDTANQGFEQILTNVLTTGQTFTVDEAPVTLARAHTGLPAQAYVSFTFQPLRDVLGNITGLVASGIEVTEQVLARQQVQRLNHELTASNEALEMRVQARTEEAQLARQEAEHRRNELQRVFEQAPVGIAIFQGPDNVIELANTAICELWGRPPAQALGTPLFALLSELVGQGFEELLEQVRITGQPFEAREMPSTIFRRGRLDTVYWDFVYLPNYEADDTINGVIVMANEVTSQVEARQQLEQLNRMLEERVLERTHQLEEQQGLLRQILAQVPAAVATLNGPEHRFAFFNTRYAALTGNRAALHQPVATVLPEVVEQGFIDLLNQVYASGEPFVGKEIAILLERPTGPPIQQYLDFNYQPLTDRQGQVLGILVFAIDVSEQVRTRRQADTLQAAALAAVQRRAQERQDLLNLFERAPVAVALLREPEHRLEYFNTSFERLYPGEALRGRTVAEAYPGMATADVIARLDQVYATGETYQGLEQPLRTARPGGPPRYVTFTYQAYREHDRIAGVAVFIYEVTEQVRARQAREAQQQLVESVFEQSPTAIWVAEGPDYVFNTVNPLMEQILGRTRAELVGRPYFTVLPELVSQGLPELMNQVWQKGETLVVNELPAHLTYHQPGEVGYFSFVFQPLLDAEGQAGRIACVAIDVTDQVVARQQVQDLNEKLAAINEKMQATNEELNDTNNRLTRTNADLDTFVYTASHDLKAPIANIEGLLMALRQQLPPEALQAALVPRLFDMMQGSVARFQQTIGHLTDISQLQQADAPETVDLNALIRDVRLDLAPLIEAAPATLTVSVDDCTAVRVAPKTLRSVVYNLLSNAVKYRDPSRPVLVQLRAYCTPGRLVLTVQDNGLGLSDIQQGELFGMFRRLHTHVEGSGVGLFTVKRLVDNAGGTIAVASQPGIGSTFTISLPA